MSDYETRIGKMKKLDTDNLEGLCEIICNQLNITKPEYLDTYKECIKYETEKYVIVDNNIYEIIQDKDVDDYGDIFEATENIDGTIDYTLRYYNGGCGFPEAIEYALNKLNKGK